MEPGSPNPSSGSSRSPLPQLRTVLVNIFIATIISVIVVACSQPVPVLPEPRPTSTAQPAQPLAKPTVAPRLPQQAELPAAVEIELLAAGDDLASTQYPAYLLAELTGRQLSNVSLIGGAILQDGLRRVLMYEAIDPSPLDNNWPGEWENGVHDLAQTWDFTGDYLWDGQNGDFVVLWTTDPSASTRTVHGRYRSAGTESYLDAVLVVDIANGRADDVIITTTGEARSLSAGDEFQLDELILDSSGTLQSQPGISLAFEEGGHLAYTRRPVATGTFFLGISAETASGEADAVYARFEVNNDALNAGYQAYLDPARGFQLLYPETWAAPSEEQGRLLFNDPAGQTQMSLSAFPDMNDRPIVDLKQRALAAFGDVTVLYEDQVEVGQAGALRTAYGYQAPDGQRTGIMLAFAQDGQAFVLDIDGLSSEEEALVELADVVASGWANRDIVPKNSGRWTEAFVEGLSVTVPADHRPHRLENGWQRFAGSDELTFLAIRSEPAAERGLFNGLEHWLAVAGGNVQNFSRSEIYAHQRNDRSWARVDFEYALEDAGRMAGAIMITRIADRFLIVWAEAPLEEFASYEQRVLLSVIDELSRERLATDEDGTSN